MRLPFNKRSSPKFKMIKAGIVAGSPIIFGYIPIAITYGVLASQSGLSLFELTAMSILVYAGAAQFMGVNMIAIGTGAIEVILATFVLNFRHFVMSLSFTNRTRKISNKWQLLLTSGLTDESFSVASLHIDKTEKKEANYFYGSLMLTAYGSWVSGSFLGGLLGDIIPDVLSQSMGIALYAMFIALLIPPVKKELRYAYIAVIAMIFNYILTYQFTVAQGWGIVFSTLLASFIGMLMMKEKQP